MPESSGLVRKELAHIIEKFPEYRLKIIHLYTADDDFRELCDDYWYSSHFLAECSLQKTYAHNLLATEYNGICQALEQEAEKYVQRR